MFDHMFEASRPLITSAGTSFSMREQVDRIAGWERLIAHAQARQAMEVAAFAEERSRRDAAGGATGVQAGRHAMEEVALARGVSPTTASYQVAFASALVDDHQHTLAAMLAGQVSLPAARTIVAECQVLAPEQRAIVDAAVAVEAAVSIPGQVRSAVRRRVAAIDPGAALARARAARARRRVSVVAQPDATAGLWALLPAEQAVACWSALDDYARGRRGDGDERSIDRIMCDTLVERVTGLRRATDLAVEVGVVISAGSLLGVDHEPATLGGYGSIPPQLAQELANSPIAWCRRLVCDPIDGRVLARGSRRRRFTGPLRGLLLARDQLCRFPGCTAVIRDADHIKGYAAGGDTSLSNGHALCERSHYCREHLGWDLEADPDSPAITWITPTGHRYDSYPPPALGPGSLPPAALMELRVRARRRRNNRRRKRRQDE